jgi:acyl-CoA thioester hydrolase
VSWGGFTKRLTATPDSIDELGHVNNAVWVQWIQAVATAHWQAVAPLEHREAYFWVVVRHEIDYLRALGPGMRVTARTWVANAPRGARFDRFMHFTGDDGTLHVSAVTSWVLLDRASGKPRRVTPEILAPFRLPYGAKSGQGRD